MSDRARTAKTKKRSRDGLYKDPRSPYWQIDKAFAAHRLRCSSGCTDRTEAKAIVDTWVAEIKKKVMAAKLGIAPPPEVQAREITLNDAATRYFDEVGCRAKSDDQIDDNLAWICEHFAPKGDGAKTPLSAITENLILELAAVRRGAGQRGDKKSWKPVSEHTINRAVLDNLRALMTRARDTWKMHVAAIEWKTVYTPRSRSGLSTREISKAKEQEYRQNLRRDLLEATEFDMIHGVRWGAMMRMEHEHCDFDANVFRVRRKTRLPGEHWQEIPMTARSRELLLAQVGRHPKFVWTYVVHRRHGRWKAGDRRPLTKAVLRAQHAHAATAAGLEAFRPHDFRHTMARRTLRKTKNLMVVKEALGHADVATTAIYAPVLIDDVRRGLEETTAPAAAPAAPAQPADRKRKKRA